MRIRETTRAVMTIEDLRFMRGWVDAYEPDDEADPNIVRVKRIVNWVDAEIERREVDKVIRDVMADTGQRVSRKVARKALAETRDGAST